jgi:hypothetical protein
MPEYKSTRILGAITFVSLAGVFVQSADVVRAAEECLSKPNSSAPQGQHWYYRMDHANGRQCWRLGPVGLRVQKTAAATEKRSAAAAASETSARTPRPVTTGHASAETATEPNVAPVAAAPAYWLDASRLLNQSSTVPPAVQQPSFEERSTGSSDSPPSAEESPAPARSVVASAGDALPQTVARAEEPQRAAPAPRPAVKTSIVDDDHTFALLLLMFVTLAIAGPMLHFSERRRRRLAKPFQPPRWAPTDTATETADGIEMPLVPATAIDQSPELPPTSPFETERLEKALQRLLDRLQTEHQSIQSAALSARMTEPEMKKSA